MRSNLTTDTDRLRAYAELPALRILVINDDHGVSQLLRIILEGDGHIVLTTDRGTKGVELASMGPDLIICDVRMPGLDGFGVVRALKNNPLTRDIPFFFLTGSVDADEMQRGITLGADDCLSMPFAKGDLAAAIVASCAKHELRGQRLRAGANRSPVSLQAPLRDSFDHVQQLRPIT